MTKFGTKHVSVEERLLGRAREWHNWVPESPTAPWHDYSLSGRPRPVGCARCGSTDALVLEGDNFICRDQSEYSICQNIWRREQERREWLLKAGFDLDEMWPELPEWLKRKRREEDASLTLPL